MTILKMASSLLPIKYELKKIVTSYTRYEAAWYQLLRCYRLFT